MTQIVASELPPERIDALFSVLSRADDAQRAENNLLGRRLAEANALGEAISKDFDKIEAELRANKKTPKDVIGAVGNLHSRQDALFARLLQACKEWQENTHKRDAHAEQRISEILAQCPKKD